MIVGAVHRRLSDSSARNSHFVCDRIWCAIVASSCYLTLISFLRFFSLRFISFRFVFSPSVYWTLIDFISNSLSPNTQVQMCMDRWMCHRCFRNEINLFVCFQHRFRYIFPLNFTHNCFSVSIPLVWVVINTRTMKKPTSTHAIHTHTNTPNNV